MIGLSPRVRGNPTIWQPGSPQMRSIPACAGEPSWATPPAPHPRVYPRVCGGTTELRIHSDLRPGLSPRVRGNPASRPKPTRRCGSIPACAGEPALTSTRASAPRVYPRVCGGTLSGVSLTLSVIGLSPRVRGNPRRIWRLTTFAGSIPACAGEPQSRTQNPAGRQVYPRVCGGTSPGIPMAGTRKGLSPRVRGNLSPARSVKRFAGSIPACAGEPHESPVGVPEDGVYPRVCGGTHRQLRWRRRCKGLSPRVRGNPRARRYQRRGKRSIPACAGEPILGAKIAVIYAVYPRVCGGTYAKTACMECPKGLSPRVRGNLANTQPGYRAGRSIPACAGEPVSAE